jgi:uncharacterized UBP type Zn finger protein
MTITENEMIDLLHMGFTLREARVGLRACNKSTNDAIQWLLVRKDNEEKKKLERAEKKRQKKYGKTVTGNRIDMALLAVFVSQGYEEEMVAEALKQSDNNSERTSYLLTNETQLLQIAVNNSKPPYIPQEKDILDIVALGFSVSQATGTLKFTRGDINATIDKLLNGEGVEDTVPPLATFPNLTTVTSPDPATTTSTPDPAATTISPEPVLTEEEREKIEREKSLLQEAENELLEDYEADPLQAYDIDLTDETQFISHFKTLISSI